jgi:acyl-coenzyme A thioesterase 9
MFISHLKNPIVHKLWTARQEAKQQKSRDECDLKRTPSQSQTDISYPFSTDEFLKETYRNPWGQMRFGKILEDLDALAGNIAFAHVQDPHMNIVTASVDRIRLRTSPNLETDQHLQGKVTFVGTSSMEIRMQCINQGKEWMEAYFTTTGTNDRTRHVGYCLGARIIIVIGRFQYRR